jgi:hypothetical protein
LLRADGGHDEAEAELCMNILGLDRTASSMLELDQETDTARTGLLVWGEPGFPGRSLKDSPKGGSGYFLDHLSNL